MSEYVCNQRDCGAPVHALSEGRWVHEDVRLDRDHPVKPLPRSTAERAGQLSKRRDAGEKALAFLEAEVSYLDRPFGMHTYNKGGIHENDCPACAQRERMRAVLTEATR